MELEPREEALLQQLRAQEIRIPPRPQVLLEIEQLLADENASERMIAQLVGRDMSLSAEIFKLVNSPYYRRGAKIESLDHAIRMMGRRQIGTTVRSVALRRQLGADDPRLETFWEHCTGIAVLCSVLCEQLDRPGKLTTDQAYLLGLFHDCGVPVLIHQIEGYGTVPLATRAAPDYLGEDDDHATSHCIAGLLVAQEWQLPDMLCEAIRAHHYVIDETVSAPQALALLQLARHAYITHQDWEHSEWAFQGAAALTALDLDPNRLEAVMQEALSSFSVLH